MTAIIYRGTDIKSFLNDMGRHIEYNKKFKWLDCGMCHEMTPHERYVVKSQSCISCANKDLMEYEKHKDTMEDDEKWIDENDFRVTEDDLVK